MEKTVSALIARNQESFSFLYQEIIDGLLKDLPYDNPLSGIRQGVATNLGMEASFISAIMSKPFFAICFASLSRL